MNHLRLLIVYSSHSPVCGIGTWIECLSEQLGQRGWDVVVGLSWGRSFHDPKGVEALRPRLQTVRLDGRTGTRVGRWLAIRDAIRRVQPHVVLVTLLDDGLRVMQAEKRRGSSIRFGFANHGNAPAHLAATLELSRDVDLIVSVNRASYQLLREWPNARWPNDVLQYISNAVPAPSVARQPTTCPIRLGFVGRLTQDKGAEQIEDLVSVLRERGCCFHLTIAGDGPLSRRVAILAETFPQQIAYRGCMARDELYQDVYPKLDVILCLSPSEGWPMSVAEAMAHGAAPVSSAYLGVHVENVIRDGETGLLFPYGQPHAAADRIVELAQNPQRLAELQSAAQREILEHHSLEQFGDRWDACLRQTLERAPRKPEASNGVCIPSLRDRGKEWFRRALGRSVSHQSVRAEWPMIAPRDPRLEEAVRLRLAELGAGQPAVPTASD